MNDQRFDDLVRRLARTFGQATGRKESRRTVLKTLGGAGATLAAAPALCASGASAAPRTIPLRSQETSASEPVVQQLAFDLEYDLEKIFRFVADDIGYETYNGALRGIRGTLWSGAANSVDKAQLLAALLDEALIETRFASGELPEGAARDLAATVGVRRERSETLTNALETLRESGGTEVTPTAVPEVELEIDPEEVVDRLTELRDELFAEAAASVEEDVELISDLLTDAGVDIPTQAVELAGMERERHVWLQARQGSEWLDLDPSFAGIELGEAPATAAETAAELAEELFHTLTFRVIVETASGEATAEQTLLDYTVRSQSMVGEDLLIMHVDPASLEAIGTGIAEALSGELTYYPLIVLGDEGYLADTPVRLGGSGGVLSDDVFGGGEAGAVEGEALAERYEVEVRSPGAEPVTISRMLFDRIPAAQRATGTIALKEIAKVAEVDLGNDERGVPEVKRVVALASVVSAVDADYLNRPIPEDTFISTYTGAIHGMYAIREALDAELAELPGTYYDRPNLAAYTCIPIPADDGGNPGVRLEADLLHQGYGFTAEAEGAAAGIYAGVLAQRAERLAVSQAVFEAMEEAGVLPLQPEVPVADVQAVFAAAAEQDIDLVVLTPEDAGPLDELEVEDAVRERLAALLAEEKVVIVPAEPVEVAGEAAIAWWVYDPATGALVDQLPDGRSGATILLGPMAEYAVKLWTYAKTVKGFLALGACVTAVMRGAAAVIQQRPGRAGALANVAGNLGGAAFSCGAFVAGALGT